MDPRTSVQPEATPVSADSIDELLGDMEVADSDAGAEIIEELPHSDDLSEDEEAALSSAIARQEAYEEQPAATTETITEPEKLAETAAPAPKKGKGASASKPKEPKIDLNGLDPKFFVLETPAPADLAANKAAVLAARPTQKKIAEKFDNLILAFGAGKTPSTYTMELFQILDQKGEATSAELVAGLKASSSKSGGYSQGTAMSQTGQIMNLFAALKIATRNGNKLTVNPNSTFAKAMREALAAGA